MCKSQYEILKHVQNLSKMNRNWYLLKESRWLSKSFLFAPPIHQSYSDWKYKVWNIESTYPICSATGMLSGKFTMWNFKLCQVSLSADPTSSPNFELSSEITIYIEESTVAVNLFGLWYLTPLLTLFQL